MTKQNINDKDFDGYFKTVLSIKGKKYAAAVSITPLGQLITFTGEES